MLARLPTDCKPAYLLSGLNPGMSTLIERLNEVMDAKEWGEDDLAHEVRRYISRQAVSQWFGKGSKLIKSIGNMEAAKALEEATGYSALWIAKGEGPKMADEMPGWTPELKRSLKRLNADELRRIENMLRAHLEMEALPRAEPGKRPGRAG